MIMAFCDSIREERTLGLPAYLRTVLSYPAHSNLQGRSSGLRYQMTGAHGKPQVEHVQLGKLQSLLL